MRSNALLLRTNSPWLLTLTVGWPAADGKILFLWKNFKGEGWGAEG